MLIFDDRFDLHILFSWAARLARHPSGGAGRRRRPRVVVGREHQVSSFGSLRTAPSGLRLRRPASGSGMLQDGTMVRTECDRPPTGGVGGQIHAGGHRQGGVGGDARVGDARLRNVRPRIGRSTWSPFRARRRARSRFEPMWNRWCDSGPTTSEATRPEGRGVGLMEENLGLAV
jgi:hypothetical protein